MGDILKEAIADAKSVRELALQNAKLALEEAFTPQLKSMLSAKLKEEDLEDELQDVPADEQDDGEDAVEAYDEEEVSDGMDTDDVKEGEMDDEAAEEMMDKDEMMSADEEEVPADEMSYSEEEEPAEEMEDEMPAEEEDDLDLESIIRELEDEMSEEDPVEEGEEEDEDTVDETIEVNGIRYAPIKEEEEVDEEEDEVNESEDGMEGESENVEGKEKPEHVGGNIGETVYEIDDDLVEQSDSSDIGKGDNKLDYADSGDEEDPGKGDDKPGDAAKGNIGEELQQYKEAVVYLKDKLHEVNILNAKLLFTNKLFKNYVLDNGQKLRVVENFDRAQTVREIKLVYATLIESFNSANINRKKAIKESIGGSSRSVGTSKPKRKVISEETQVADRFKQLAGLK